MERGQGSRLGQRSDVKGYRDGVRDQEIQRARVKGVTGSAMEDHGWRMKGVRGQGEGS